ncbi:MAG TPA: DUF5655 domain-containing protein [Vicinamibacterales bacterium]|jgi:hypothetical protein
MAGRECFHCRQWIEPGEEHDCWTTTEAALTEDLSEDLKDAWERLRETAVAFGDQRIYASHNSIMFSRKSCYFFVRPKKNFLEVCVFLGRTLKAPQVRRTMAASRAKVAHIVHIKHRDEVEPPVTEWLQEAYDRSEALYMKRPVKPAASKTRRRPRSAASINQPKKRRS